MDLGCPTCSQADEVVANLTVTEQKSLCQGFGALLVVLWKAENKSLEFGHGGSVS